MKYYEGADYWVHYVEFPNAASESVVVSNGDGTFSIFMNTLFPEDVLERKLAHELNHLEEEHFYRDDLTIRDVERQADGKKPVDPFLDAPPRMIPVFSSLNAFTAYVYSKKPR